MASLKDIAAICGVSVATVSRALNNLPDISQGTKERVQAAADELGYFTNSAARALKTNRTYNLGVLYDDRSSRGLTHSFFAALLDSFKREAERAGYDITFINNRRVGGKPMTYLQHSRYRGVDGLLLACVDFYDEQILEVIQSTLPAVTIDHVFNSKPAVISDNIDGMEQLVRYACSRGHKKLALLYGDPTAVTEKRKTGFFRGCEENGVSVPDEWVLESRYYDPENCYQVTKGLLRQKNRPTCILFPDDSSLTGGVQAIFEEGLRIPEDMSIMGYDGIAPNGMTKPRITTLRQDTNQLGKVAARKLIDLIEHPKTVLLDRVVIQGELIPGETVLEMR